MAKFASHHSPKITTFPHSPTRSIGQYSISKALFSVKNINFFFCNKNHKTEMHDRVAGDRSNFPLGEKKNNLDINREKAYFSKLKDAVAIHNLSV